MGDYVELKNKEGGFHDPETGFSLSRDDSKELTEPVGKLTQERLASGALVRSKPKRAARQAESVATNTSEGSEEPVTTDEPAEVPGQDDGQEADKGADKTVPEQTAPAPSKKRPSKKKAPK